MAAIQRNSRVSASRFSAAALIPEEPSEPPETSVERWRLWYANPGKFRTQFEVGTATVTAVWVGQQWWSWMPGAGVKTNAGDSSHSHGLGPGAVLVEAPILRGSLKLQAVSRATFLSRSAYLVGAAPAQLDVHLPPFVLHALGAGADRYEMVVDAEVGLVWRSQAEFEGEAFRILEVEEVGINEALDDRLFDPESLDG